MSDVDLALGYGNRFDVRGAEGIRNLCLAGEGVKHDMNFVGLVDDLFSAMVLAVLQVFHGEGCRWVRRAEERRWRRDSVT
jgi:hypothetical protein